MAAAAAWGLLVLGPPLALTAQAFGLADGRPAGAGALWLAAAWPSPSRWALLARSAALAGGVAVAATVLGFLAATLLWRVRWRRARWLLLAWAPLPPYVHALAWTTAWARWTAGWGGSWVPGDGLARGALGAGWVMTMAALPVATGLALVALCLVPPELLAAARLARPDGAVLRRVVLPLCAPLLVAAAGILFALQLLDYSVPALFQVEVFALALFADFSAHGSAARAAWSALPLVGLAAVTVATASAGLRHAALRAEGRTPSHGATACAPDWAWPPAWRLGRAVAGAALVAHLGVPLVFLVLGAGGLESWWASLSAAAAELRFSLVTAAVVVALGLPLASAAAAWLETGRVYGWVLVLAPLALPAPLVAIGFISLWNRPGLWGAIYDAGPAPAMVALARFLPLAALVLLAWRRRRDPLPLAAGRLMGGAPLRRRWRIDLPLALPGLAATAALLFALCLGELGATLLVAPAGRATLAMRTFNYMHYGASEAVAGLCLTMAAATALCGLVALRLLSRPVRA